MFQNRVMVFEGFYPEGFSPFSVFVYLSLRKKHCPVLIGSFGANS